MNIERSHFHYALITLEATSAHGIHSGASSATHDVLLLRDGNGLPALAGTSIAGVLRHLYQQQHGEETTRALFGWQATTSSTKEGDSDGEASPLIISWGLVHDSHDQPVEGIRTDDSPDPLLNLLASPHPMVRQRVRLNAYGSAEQAGKFDVSQFPAGTRYSFFISYWSNGSRDADQQWQQLLALFNHPAFRLGHGTRAGAGSFRLLRLHGACWNLTQPVGRQAFVNRPRLRKDARQLPKINLDAPAVAVETISLNLRAEAGWRVGGGDQAIGLEGGDGKTPDMLPISEPRIDWKQEKGKTDRGTVGSARYLLPATAVKGALAHRLAYHYRCLSNHWVTQDGPEPSTDCPAVQELFGTLDNDKGGSAGRLLLDDLLLDQTITHRQMHNRIDRFSGGVINGALFEEALLWQTPIKLRLILLPGQPLSLQTRQALERTLDDLANGWLPLGAGGSRGHGIFIAEDGVHWSATPSALATTEVHP